MMPLPKSVSPGVVTDVAAAVPRAVTVEDFFPVTRRWHPNAIRTSNDRGKVTTDENRRDAFETFAKVDQRAVVRVHTVDPLEAFVAEVELVKGGIFQNQLVQVRDQFLDSTMGLKVQQEPVGAVIVVPFIPLAELTAHE